MGGRGCGGRGVSVVQLFVEKKRAVSWRVNKNQSVFLAKNGAKQRDSGSHVIQTFKDSVKKEAGTFSKKI